LSIFFASFDASAAWLLVVPEAISTWRRYLPSVNRSSTICTGFARRVRYRVKYANRLVPTGGTFRSLCATAKPSSGSERNTAASSVLNQPRIFFAPAAVLNC